MPEYVVFIGQLVIGAAVFYAKFHLIPKYNLDPREVAWAAGIFSTVLLILGYFGSPSELVARVVMGRASMGGHVREVIDFSSPWRLFFDWVSYSALVVFAGLILRGIWLHRLHRAEPSPDFYKVFN